MRNMVAQGSVFIAVGPKMTYMQGGLGDIGTALV